MEDVIKVKEGIAQVPADVYVAKLEKIEDFILVAKKTKSGVDEDMYKFFWTVEVNGKKQTLTELCNKEATPANKLGKTIKALLKKDVRPGDEIKMSSLVGFTCKLVVEEYVKDGYKNSKITARVPITSAGQEAMV